MLPKRAALRSGWAGLLQTVAGHGAVENAASADLINILDSVEVPIVVVGRDFLIAGFNETAAEVLGLSPSDIGRACRDVLAGFSRLEQLCRQVIALGVESPADFRDGDKWFAARISPYTNGDGQVAGAVLTFTNVTAFRASVGQAIYERECTKAILNTVADPLVVLSADHWIQSGNRAFYTMFEVSRETQGVPLYDLGNGALDSAPLRQQLTEMLAGTRAFQPLEVDHVLTAKGRRTLILDARPLSFPGHSERRVLVTFRDITARKQAQAARDLRSEEELRRSETFLAEGQRLSLTGSFSWKVATDKITWSEQLYRIYEIEVGVPVTLELIRSRVHPDDLSLIERMRMVDRAHEGADSFEWQYRLLMPDRSIKYMHAVAHAIRDHEGQVEYIAAVQDVTARRISEEALDKARAELAHVARVMSLGELTASITHEVNQPLSGIITNASTCLRMLDAAPPNVDGARETAKRTIRDGHRASDVIQRLRALFTKKEFSPEPLDLNELTREVIALSSSELQRKRVVLQAELADDLPAITGDRVQIQQVILNLFLNALDAMSNVGERPKQLVVRTRRDEDDRVRLSLQDTGVGIGPEGLERPFEPFYTTKSGGMGIGLSVSRSIIESHRGRLWAAANDGPGATFSFSIPASPRP